MERKAVYAGIVTAAGLSRRMGEFKPLLPLDGKTMIETTVQSILQTGAKTVLVVTGCCSGEIEEVFARRQDSRVQLVHNPNYRRSDMLESIRTGLYRLPPVDAAFILPGDIPLIAKSTFQLLQHKMETGRFRVVLPTLAGRQSHPPLIHHSCFETICSFRETGGLRAALRLFEKDTACIPVNDRGCSMDADTPEQYCGMLLYSAAKPNTEQEVDHGSHQQVCYQKGSCSKNERSGALCGRSLHGRYALRQAAPLRQGKSPAD